MNWDNAIAVRDLYSEQNPYGGRWDWRLGYFLGVMDGIMIALLVFMALDYVTGVMCVIAEKKFSSTVRFKGICKKVQICLLQSRHRLKPHRGGFDCACHLCRVVIKRLSSLLHDMPKGFTHKFGLDCNCSLYTLFQ